MIYTFNHSKEYVHLVHITCVTVSPHMKKLCLLNVKQNILQEEAFLEDINMILNTADIPNLYENEDRLEIIEKV